MIKTTSGRMKKKVNHMNISMRMYSSYAEQKFKQNEKICKRLHKLLPVAMRLSPGASIAPGGRMKQLFGAVV